MTCHRQVIHYAPPPVCGRASSHHPSALIRGNTSVVSLHISGAPKIMCIGAPTAAAISETNRSIRRILHGFTAKNHTSIRPPTCLKICRLSVMDKEQPIKDSIYPCRIIQVQIVPRQNGAAKTMPAHCAIYVPIVCDDPIMLGSVVRFRALLFLRFSIQNKEHAFFLPQSLRHPASELPFQAEGLPCRFLKKAVFIADDRRIGGVYNIIRSFFRVRQSVQAQFHRYKNHKQELTQRPRQSCARLPLLCCFCDMQSQA